MADKTVRAFWHKGDGKNFGDWLTPWLLAKQYIPTVWKPPEKAEFFGCGSVAARIPKGFTGYVWGTGLIKEGQVAHIDDAKVLALRGPLTGEAPLYADPGLLAGLYADEEKRYPVGVIPHWVDDLPHEGRRISIRGKPEDTIRAAARCERIVTSSLHGLILADSLGIPNQWVYSEKVIGDGHKFRDYAASFGETIEPDVWRLAPQDQVEEKQSALVAALKGIKNECV